MDEDTEVRGQGYAERHAEDAKCREAIQERKVDVDAGWMQIGGRWLTCCILGKK